MDGATFIWSIHNMALPDTNSHTWDYGDIYASHLHCGILLPIQLLILINAGNDWFIRQWEQGNIRVQHFWFKLLGRFTRTIDNISSLLNTLTNGPKCRILPKHIKYMLHTQPFSKQDISFSFSTDIRLL